MNLTDYAEVVDDLFESLVWLRVDWVEHSEAPSGGMILFDSFYSGRWFAYIESDGIFSWVQPLQHEEEQAPITRDSRVLTSDPPQFLALDFMTQEIARITNLVLNRSVAPVHPELELHMVQGRRWFDEVAVTLAEDDADYERLEKTASRALWDAEQASL